MMISYAILTHNEGEYLKDLFPFLIENIREGDEIVVVDDYSTDTLTVEVLDQYKDHIKLHYREFDGDHTQKNYLNSKCIGDYIFQLDADEIVKPEFVAVLPEILQTNPEVELYYVPRINKVTNLTEDFVKKWGWRLNDRGWVNYPDYQMRIYKNSAHIQWDGLLHSVIKGHKSYAALPQEELFSMIHLKSLDRQIQQNDLYDKIEANGRKQYKL